MVEKHMVEKHASSIQQPDYKTPHTCGRVGLIHVFVGAVIAHLDAISPVILSALSSPTD
jgi:hypothetical protein